MNNIIIFSVFQKDVSEDANYMNTIKVESMLKRTNIPFKAVQGVYKGTKEESFIIDLKYINAAMELARHYNQESILVIDANSNATLKYMPVTVESDSYLGIFQEVLESTAKTLDAYTYDIETGTYYACLPERRQTDRISFNTKTWRINEPNR